MLFSSPLVRYLITLVRCETGDVEKLIASAKGRYVDELDIPASDVEEVFFEEYNEAEENEEDENE